MRLSATYCLKLEASDIKSLVVMVMVLVIFHIINSPTQLLS